MIYIIGRGYLGSALADHFANRGKDMTVIGRHDIWPKFEYEDTIINCAASGYRRHHYGVEGTVRDNYELPKRILDKSNGANIIHFSSWTEQFSFDVYSHSKALATQLMLGRSHVCMTCTVWGGPFEDPSKFMMNFLRACAHGYPFAMYYPFQRRDFVHVSTFCDAVEKLTLHREYKVRYFATGRLRSFYEVYGTLTEVAGRAFPNVQVAEDLSTTHEWRAKEPEFEDTFRDDLAKEWRILCK